MKKNDSTNRILKNIGLVVAVIALGGALGALAHMILPIGLPTPKVETQIQAPAAQQQAAQSTAPVAVAEVASASVDGN